MQQAFSGIKIYDALILPSAYEADDLSMVQSSILCYSHIHVYFFVTEDWYMSHSDSTSTVMCLSIGTPKSKKFSICSNVKLIIFRCPKI